MSLALEGSSVLLTGATGGIGGAIARALHGRGAALVLSGRRADALEALRQELGVRAEVVACDLSDRADVAGLARRAEAVDALVANAALPATGRIEELTPEQIDRALDVNLRAPVQLARAAVPGMVARGRGHLVFVSSMSGKVVGPSSALYSATKFGLRAFAAALREDLDGTGVGASTVFPGFISGAGMFAETGVGLPRGVGTRTPEQVADAVLRGVECGTAEIDVAPLPLRAGALVAAVAPSLSARIQRRLGSRELADAIARAQAAKR